MTTVHTGANGKYNTLGLPVRSAKEHKSLVIYTSELRNAEL